MQNVLQFSVAFEIDVALPPGVYNSGDLIQRLVFEIDIVFGRFDRNLVGAVTGRHLEHTDSPQVYFRKDPESRKLIRHHARPPAMCVGRLTFVANREYLRRSLVFSSVTEWTSSSDFGRLFFASRLGSLGPRREEERSEEHTSELQSLAYLVCP